MGFLNLNRATIIGRLGGEVKINNTQGGNPVCNFSVATNNSWKDKQSGEWKENTDWHKVVVWGNQAESCAKYLGKGSIVYVEGRLCTRDYTDKDGIKRYTTEIIADKVQWPKESGGGSGSQGGGGGEFGGYQGSGGNGSGGGGLDDSDVPF